jgi:pimeloyl-ACP methyl ester carboxylesterase
VTAFDWREGGRGGVRIGGLWLEAAVYGPPPERAPTIVMLHEGLGCVDLWRDFPARLAAATGFGVFVYSRFGYGVSDGIALPRPLDYMTREAVDVLPKILDSIGLRRGILLGHSDGATIAAIHGGSAPDPRVRGLILMAPHFFTEQPGLAAIRLAREAYEQGDLRARLARYHGHVDVAFRGWCESWLDPGFLAWNVADSIEGWRVPVLAIQGVDDQYGTLAQIREIERRARVPVQTAILGDCKHAPQFEQPERTLAAITEFCAGLGAI